MDTTCRPRFNVIESLISPSDRREASLSDCEGGWSFETELEEEHIVRLSGPAPTAGAAPGLDLILLSAVLKETFAIANRTGTAR